MDFHYNIAKTTNGLMALDFTSRAPLYYHQEMFIF